MQYNKTYRDKYIRLQPLGIPIKLWGNFVFGIQIYLFFFEPMNY